VSGLQATATAPRAFRADSASFAAFLRPDGSVSVYRRSPCGRGLGALLGVGRFENGLIVGANINCGILVQLEGSLRLQTGTP
jgi:hypothetical protein